MLFEVPNVQSLDVTLTLPRPMAESGYRFEHMPSEFMAQRIGALSGALYYNTPSRFTPEGVRLRLGYAYLFRERDWEVEEFDPIERDRAQFSGHSFGLEFNWALSSPYTYTDMGTTIAAKRKDSVPFVVLGIQLTTFNIGPSPQGGSVHWQGLTYSAGLAVENRDRVRFGIVWNFRPDIGQYNFSSLGLSLGGRF